MEQDSLHSNDEPKARRGRPVGSVKVDPSPEQLIREELLRQLKLFTRLREIVETRLRAKHEEELTVEDLSGLMDLLLKGITQMSKVVIAPQRPSSDQRSEEDEDPSKILEALQK
jgi:hypothetical protein